MSSADVGSSITMISALATRARARITNWRWSRTVRRTDARQNRLSRGDRAPLALRKARSAMATETAHPSSLAEPTLRRQTSEVGAVCLNRARTDLCGGRVAMRVPTAKAKVGRRLTATSTDAIMRDELLNESLFVKSLPNVTPVTRPIMGLTHF